MASTTDMLQQHWHIGNKHHPLGLLLNRTSASCLPECEPHVSALHTLSTSAYCCLVNAAAWQHCLCQWRVGKIYPVCKPSNNNGNYFKQRITIYYYIEHKLKHVKETKMCSAPPVFRFVQFSYFPLEAGDHMHVLIHS